MQLNLILQGPTLQRSDANAVADMARATAVEELSGRAFRLRNGAKDEALAAYCEARNIDYGWVPEGTA